MKYLEALLPIYRVYQLCGIAPFSVPFDVGTQKRSNKWTIYNGALIVYLSALVIHNIVSYQTFLEGKSSEMLTYLSYIIICAMRALAVITVVESTLKSKQQIVLLRQLDSVDDILHDDLGIELDYKKIRRNAIGWMTFWTIMIAVVMSLFLVEVFHDYESKWERFKWFLYFIPLFVSSFKYFQIIQYIKSLELCFQIVNQKLEQIFSSKNRLSTESKSLMKKNAKPIPMNDSVHDEIVSLRRIYHILWKSTAQFNSAFRWCLLLLIGASFSIILVNYYRLLVWLITPDKKHVTEMVTYFVWSLSHTFYFIRLSSVCYNVSQEVCMSNINIAHCDSSHYYDFSD